MGAASRRPSWKLPAARDNIRGLCRYASRTSPRFHAGSAEFAPLVAFFVAYYLRGLYVATAVLMVAMVAAARRRLAAAAARSRPCMPVGAVLVLVFGGADAAAAQSALHPVETHGASLARRAPRFLGSFWIGKRTAHRAPSRATALGEQLQVSPRAVAALNGWWVGVLCAARARSTSRSRTTPASVPGSTSSSSD